MAGGGGDPRRKSGLRAGRTWDLLGQDRSPVDPEALPSSCTKYLIFATHHRLAELLGVHLPFPADKGA